MMKILFLLLQILGLIKSNSQPPGVGNDDILGSGGKSASGTANRGIVSSLWNRTTAAGETVKIILGHHEEKGIHFVNFKFKGRPCAEFDNITISNSNETAQLIHNRLGPDEVLVHIEGASLQTLLPVHKGCNLYSAHFEVPVSGIYNIKLAQLRREYAAFNEMIDETPKTFYEVILDEIVNLTKMLNKTSGSCSGHWVSVAPESVQLNETYMLSEDARRGFVRGLPIQTRIRLSNTSTVTESDGKKFTCAETTDGYDWVVDCADTKTALYTPTQAGQVLAGKRLLLIGDSHVRTFLKQLIRWACAADFPEAKRISTSMTIPATADRCAGLHASYFVEYFCGVHSIPNTKDFDLVLANCGHHPAAGDGRFKLTEYKEIVQNMVNHAASKGFTGKNFVFLESTPEPLRYDKWFISYKDWRSFQRLHVFNEEAAKIVKKNTTVNFSVIPAFRDMMPFIDKICDNAHYGIPEALTPIFQRYVRKVAGD